MCVCVDVAKVKRIPHISTIVLENVEECFGIPNIYSPIHGCSKKANVVGCITYIVVCCSSFDNGCGTLERKMSKNIYNDEDAFFLYPKK